MLLPILFFILIASAPSTNASEEARNGTDRLGGCLWGLWSEYSCCSATCGYGKQIRLRRCADDCGRPEFEIRECSSEPFQDCVAGSRDLSSRYMAWSDWSGWTQCYAPYLSRTRTRECVSSTTDVGGCVGDSFQEDNCFFMAGGLSFWGDWFELPCSTTCGRGTLIRIRYCYRENFETAMDCVGGISGSGFIDSEEVRCTVKPCPPGSAIDGMWSYWTDWASCSVTCGNGQELRFRLCNDPAPENGGLPCPQGPTIDQRDCYRGECPTASVDGNWGDWSPWSSCTASCGTSTQTRYRECNQPYPQGRGKPCTGPVIDEQSCSLPACPASQPGKSIFQECNLQSDKTLMS